MGDVIQFPFSEDDFLRKFKAPDLPPELVDCLKNAYRNIVQKLEDSPSVTFKPNPDYMKEVEQFRQEYRAFLLSMLQGALAKDVEICMLKLELSKLRN
ncbi:hypothetical protein ThidrDRAFT_3196 [Thiorhodococcus drewsii AZ1]|uniref:Uncharacterized protein n=1 Tax=Thiorhodococcus drewsii AZ1 TaxID=765913 RepID=G2E4I3_9GAMM|nr:hypothetical protein [Thiorhodococcus drewsii]EGV29604.1 hypothetical protein ThidrDRAFT_3196 [Thiorhodococcus drewsii AZ1]